MAERKISVILSAQKNFMKGLMKRLTRENIGDQSGIDDLKKYIFLKKLKSDTELQILRVSLFLNSLPKNYKLLTNANENKNTEDNSGNIIKILRMNLEYKDKKEILKLKNFFISVGLHKLFEFPNYSEQLIEKLIIYCCINSKTKMFKRNSIIYNANDIFDKFYILIRGKVGIYKTIEKTIKISGFSYFQYIYDLYLKKEEYLLKLILEKNNKLFPINENMMENLNINLAKYIINNLQKDQEYLNAFKSQKEILKMCYINPDDFSNINDDPNENKEKNSIYELLSKTKDKNNIYIYEYLQIETYIEKQIIETFNNNDIIMNYKIANNNINYIYNNTPPRKYALKALSDTYLCFFDLEEYIFFFIEIYKNYMREQASFLINNFIFQRIAKHFYLHYFNYFEFEEVKANEYLFKENNPVEYIYLLKKGIVELAINKNIFKIRDLINQLSSNLEYSNNTTNKSGKDIVNKIKEVELEKVIIDTDSNKRLNENKKEKIVILEQNEIIGIECLYLDINYFYDAKVGNKDARFYKIRKDKLLKILDMEQTMGINLDYQKEAQRKINFFLLRLINLSKVKINNIRLKKFHNIINVYNKMNIGRNYRKVKLYGTYKKTRLRLKALDDPIDSRNKKKNSDSSFINSINIFELTNAENNKSDTNNKNKKLNIKNMKNALINKRSNTESNLNMYDENELLKNNRNFPKININNQAFLSLKKEENFANKLFKKLSNDNLFFTKINKDNEFKNFKLIDKIQTLKSNSSYNGDIYDNWRTFHLNINIDSESHRKKLNKINWYKNIDKFPYNSDERKENIKNRIFYGIQVDSKKVTFVDDKIFLKNNNFQVPHK